MEYLTVEYSDLHKPLKFRFADDSGAEANSLQEFLNRQEAKGWELLAAIPLSYNFKNTPEGGARSELILCRLIFRGPSWPNADNPHRDPQPDQPFPGRKLQPV